MRFNHFSTIFSLVILFSLAQVYCQDLTTSKAGDSLPESNSSVPEDGDFMPNAIREYNEAYYILSRLNTSTGLPPNEFNFQSPQATLEHFVYNARSGDFKNASYALNFNLLPDDITQEQAATLAEKLFFVLNQRIKIDWSGLSDRPDGQIDMSTSTNQAIAGKPMRSVVFGEIDLDGRDIVLRMQRIKYKDYGAFWLISANTVENIDSLYEVYGPRELDRMMPDWARIQFLNMPIWKFIGTFILILFSYLLGKLSLYIFRKIFKKSDKIWVNTIAKRLATPAGWAI
ncbi:MAG: mechanosensitive ion channel protein, partial [Leeuwenhoekiella sp.]|nr:mechanosensitive ion channel protein [Leeuwenhoekiella sp.]